MVAVERRLDLHPALYAPFLAQAPGLRSLCAFTARHFGFGQSNQSHCSGLGPCGVPSFRRRSTGPHRWAVPGPAALARRPASLPGSATPPLGLHQRRGWRRLDWRCMQGETPGARESAFDSARRRGSELALGGNPTIWRVAAVILATLFMLHGPSCCRFPADRRQASSYKDWLCPRESRIGGATNMAE